MTGAAEDDSKRGISEVRSRVSLFLPVNNRHEHQAFLAVVRYLHSQRNSKLPVTGFTRSRCPDTVFSGAWWFGGKWFLEGVVQFVVDYDIHMEDARLARTLGHLRQAIMKAYADHGSVQEEIWIIVQSVTRFV